MVFAYLYFRSLRFGSELYLQCRNYTSALKLRSLSRWCVVLLVICFERQVVKIDGDNALRRRIEFSANKEGWKSQEKTEATEQHLCEDRTAICLSLHLQTSQESLIIEIFKRIC